jgi:hypothetical protein
VSQGAEVSSSAITCPPSWRRYSVKLGAKGHGAELGAADRGAELGATDRGAELATITASLACPSLHPIFLTLSQFFCLSSTRPTSSIDVFDLKNFDLIHRSSRSRYPLSPPQFLRIDLIYIMRIIQCNCLRFRI